MMSWSGWRAHGKDTLGFRLHHTAFGTDLDIQLLDSSNDTWETCITFGTSSTG